MITLDHRPFVFISKIDVAMHTYIVQSERFPNLEFLNIAMIDVIQNLSYDFTANKIKLFLL